MFLLEIIGWLGSTLLAFCGFPQAFKSFKEKHSSGISSGFLLMWFLGELFTLFYIIPTAKLPLIVNYSFNILFLFVIIYYKIWPQKKINK